MLDISETDYQTTEWYRVKLPGSSLSPNATFGPPPRVEMSKLCCALGQSNQYTRPVQEARYFKMQLSKLKTLLAL